MISLPNDSTDFGARINAADAQLGSNPGIIQISGGGRFTTGAKVGANGPNHLLWIRSGRYTNGCVNIGWGGTGPMIRLSPHSAVMGDGFTTILQEPDNADRHSWTVIGAENALHAHDAGDNDCHAANLKVERGASSQVNTGGNALGFGNTRYGSIVYVGISGTHAMGVNLGGGSLQGKHCQNFLISHCQLDHNWFAPIALVNNKDCTVQYCKISAMAAANAIPIDMEPNGPTDFMDNMWIHHNKIDFQGTVSPASSHGIVSVWTPAPATVRANIEDNTIIGGDVATGSTLSGAGIYIDDRTPGPIHTRRNFIMRMRWAGIQSTKTFYSSYDQIIQCGGKGYYGIEITAGSAFDHLQLWGISPSVASGPYDDHVRPFPPCDYSQYTNCQTSGSIYFQPHDTVDAYTQTHKNLSLLSSIPPIPADPPTPTMAQIRDLLLRQLDPASGLAPLIRYVAQQLGA